MALIEISKNPSRRELRWFGGLLALFIALIAGLLFWRFEMPAAALSLLIAAGVICPLYYAVPGIRRSIYLGWMCAALPIGWVVSHALMAIIYLLVLLPIGLIMRLLGYDAMNRSFDSELSSYWVVRDAGRSSRAYFRLF